MNALMEMRRAVLEEVWDRFLALQIIPLDSVASGDRLGCRRSDVSAIMRELNGGATYPYKTHPRCYRCLINFSESEGKLCRSCERWNGETSLFFLSISGVDGSTNHYVETKNAVVAFELLQKYDHEGSNISLTIKQHGKELELHDADKVYEFLHVAGSICARCHIPSAKIHEESDGICDDCLSYLADRKAENDFHRQHSS